MQKEFGAFLNVFSGASAGFLEVFSCLKLGSLKSVHEKPSVHIYTSY